jgi:hypothetical protein
VDGSSFGLRYMYNAKTHQNTEDCRDSSGTASHSTGRSRRLWHTPRGKAMLGKAVAELKQDKPKALEMFNKGAGGLKDRDLYVLYSLRSQRPKQGRKTRYKYLETGYRLTPEEKRGVAADI